MRSAALLLALTLASPALADECNQWSASMQEDEGGPVMTAEICAGPAEAQNRLLVQCFDEGFVVRYLPVMPDTYPPEYQGEFKVDLALESSGRSVSVTASYEEMDGALAFYPKHSDPVIALLKGQGKITFTDAAKIVPPITFSLKNATQTFEKLEKGCGAN